VAELPSAGFIILLAAPSDGSRTLFQEKNTQVLIAIIST